MPQVKIDHIVSFSSEDPARPAASLCSSGVGAGWRCGPGDRTASVVCGLQRGTVVASMTVGAVHVALLEVLVGRSEQPDQYQVLVPRCVLLSPLESRQGSAVDRVRTWTRDQLDHTTRDQTWDRIKLVCSQPYDKQAQFGVSFVHVFSPETVTRVSMFPQEEEEEEFTPGELFRKHRSSDVTKTSLTTDAQIRQATSQALKNIIPESTALVKTNIAKDKRTSHSHAEELQVKRDRNDLMYESDDDKPNHKIDSAIDKHQKEKERQAQHNQDNKDRPHTYKRDTNIDKGINGQENQTKNKTDKTESDSGKSKERDKGKSTERDNATNIEKHRSKNTEKDSGRNIERDKERQKNKQEYHTKNKIDKDERSSGNCSVNRNKTDGDREKIEDKKRSREHEDRHRKRQKVDKTADVSSSYPLSGVVFTLSGYVNPRRADLRSTGLALGARYVADVDPTVTHILAAYHNTPKVRAASSSTVVVLGEWVEECERLMKRVPPHQYYTDPALRTAAPASRSPTSTRRKSPSSESDTDDEIQRVLQGGNTSHSAGRDRAGNDAADENDATEENDVTIENDATEENDLTNVNDVPDPMDAGQSDNDTKSPSAYTDDGDTEVDEETGCEAGDGGTLPDLLEGRTVRVRGAEGCDVTLLKRYVVAYGGTLLHEDSEEAAEVEVGPGGVSPRWVWDLHEHKTVPPIDPYLTT